MDRRVERLSSSLLFLLSITAVTSTTVIKRFYNLLKTSSSSRNSLSVLSASSTPGSNTISAVEAKQEKLFKYQNIGLIIDHPIDSDNSKYSTLLINDDILTQVTKDVELSISVLICCSTMSSNKVVTKQESLHYISMVYSKLWDELIAQNKVNVQCYVTSDIIFDHSSSSPSSSVSNGSLKHAATQFFKMSLSSPSTSYALYLNKTEASNHQELLAHMMDGSTAVSDSNKGTTHESEKQQQHQPQHLNIEDTSCFTIKLPKYPTTNVNNSTCQNQNTTTTSNRDNNDYKVYYFDSLNTPSLPSYRKIALGGSFDHLHNGHRKLLTYAATYCTKILVIGIMADVMLTKKTHASLISPFAFRKQNVINFLSTAVSINNHHHNIKIDNNTTATTHKTAVAKSTLASSSTPLTLTLDIHELFDPLGPTVTDSAIEALAVSSETIKGAITINEIRVVKGMKPLDILVLRRTDGVVLSSTFIREKLKLLNNNKDTSQKNTNQQQQ